MAIGAIETQGQILRAQDFTTVKHNEDSHAQNVQGQIQNSQEKAEVRRMQRVNQNQRTDQQNKRFDSREKGSNEYSGDGGQGRKEGRERREAMEKMAVQEEPEGKVLIKGVLKP